MSITTTGLFTDKKMAENALSVLKNKGFTTHEIPYSELDGKNWKASPHELRQALTSWGMAENQAEIFKQRLLFGHCMLSVTTDHQSAPIVLTILEEFDASDVTKVITSTDKVYLDYA